MEKVEDDCPNVEVPNSRCVRKHKYIPADDPRYSAGNDIENRLEAPPPEIVGDPFDRQRCIYDFDQNRVQRQDCLVLGAGGIGQNVGLTLARVGVRSITFVDKDKYEASNLSRQLLGSLNDLGKRKVDVAVESINKSHNISSTIADGHHLDALASWDIIVSLAKHCSVLFNGIDVGTVFDFAVNSLSKALCIPLVQGQSAGWSVNAEFYTGQPGLLCGACSSSITSSFALEGVSFSAINSRLTHWLTHDTESPSTRLLNYSEDYSIRASTMLSFLQQDKQYRVDGPTAVSIISSSIQAVNSSRTPALNESTFMNTSKDNESIRLRDFKLFLYQYYINSVKRLLPDQICSQSDILFIPRPQGVLTRYIGSWVCPCLTVAAIMVSQWINYLTGPTGRDPPSSFQLSLASCRTDICDTALECGFVQPPSQSSDQSSSSCLTCEKMSLKLEDQLFFSFIPIALAPVSGNTFKWIGEEKKPYVSTSALSDTEIPLTNITHKTVDTSTSDTSHYCSHSSTEIRDGKLWHNIDHLGVEYSSLALDAIPCNKLATDKAYVEIHSSADDSSRENSKLSQDEWPLELRVPLGKVARTVPTIDMRGGVDFIRAYGSGQRSALLSVTNQYSSLASSLSMGKWYRLKGCGMPNIGFTVEDALDDNGQLIRTATSTGSSTSDVPNVEDAALRTNTCNENRYTIRKIRGAAYQHTCGIELDMTTIVAEALKQVGMICANRSLGRWDYISSALPSTSLTSTEYPLVTRSCALFENLGDRRLSDHVLRGLELLLPLIASTASKENGQPINLTVTQISAINAVQSVRDLRIGRGIYFDIEDCDEYDDRLTRSVLLFNGGVATDTGLFANLASPLTPLKGVMVPRSDQFPSTAPKCLKGIWDRCCQLLASSSSGVDVDSEEDPCLLGYLFYRLGWECGTVGRVLQESKIMWGSYTDATGRHMNAHGNNLALVREGEVASGAFLAPLDFDMSYSKDNCYYG